MEIRSAALSEQAQLGQGYDTTQEDFKGLALTGERAYGGASNANIDYSQSYTSSDLANSLGLAVGGKARYGLVEGSAAASFSQQTTETGYSNVTIYQARYQFKNRLLSTPFSFLDIAQRNIDANGFASENWTKFFGDEVVTQVVLGSALYIAVIFEFATKEDKKQFEAEFKVAGPAFELGGKIEQASSSFSGRGTVKITAFQQGGAVERLSSIFRATSAEIKDEPNSAQVYSVLVASLDRPDAIIKSLNEAIKYAQEEFPAQIVPDMTENTAQGPAEIAYITSPWSDFGLLPQPLILQQAVQEARAELSALFEQNVQLMVRARSIASGSRGGGMTLSPRQQGQVEAVQQTLLQNLRRTKEAAVICYTEPDRAVDTVEALLPQIEEVDERLLEVEPESFRQWYEVAGRPGSLKATQQTLQFLEEGVKERIVAFDSLDKSARPDSLMRTWQGLKELSILGSNVPVDLRPLAAMPWLESVELYNTRPYEGDLTPLSILTNLRRLRLYQAGIKDISAVAHLPLLQRLDVGINEIGDLTPVSSCSHLEELNLELNEVQDLSPLTALPALRWFQWGGGNNIQNIKILNQLPALANFLLVTDKIAAELSVPATGDIWDGEWTRQGETNRFHAVWNRRQRGSVADAIQVERLGFDNLDNFSNDIEFTTLKADPAGIEVGLMGLSPISSPGTTGRIPLDRQSMQGDRARLWWARDPDARINVVWSARPAGV
jgi:hypothetical protein